MYIVIRIHCVGKILYTYVYTRICRTNEYVEHKKNNAEILGLYTFSPNSSTLIDVYLIQYQSKVAFVIFF